MSWTVSQIAGEDESSSRGADELHWLGTSEVNNNYFNCCNVLQRRKAVPWLRRLIDWLIMSVGSLLFIPRVICEHGEPWWWWCRLGITADSLTRALWQSYQQGHLGASRRNGRRSENLAYQYLRYVNWSLTCRKILRHRTSSFTSPLKEVVLQILSTLQFMPRPGLNPRSIGPVASTLTTKPQGRLLLRCLAVGLSHSVNRVSLPGQPMLDLKLTEWHWDRIFSKFVGFCLSISFYRGTPFFCGMNNRPVGDCSSETSFHNIDMNKNKQRRYRTLWQRIKHEINLWISPWCLCTGFWNTLYISYLKHT
jgi:hypothetical protein